MGFLNINIALILITIAGLFWLYVRSANYQLSYKTVLFLAGLLIGGTAIALPVGPSPNEPLFSMHMAKHVLLLMVAPPLLMAGLSEKHVQRWMSTGNGSILKKLTHPAIAWISGVGIMWFWHAPPVYNAMMTLDGTGWIHTALMALEIISLIGIGLLFCSPILFPIEEIRLPELQGIIYLFTACVGCSILGILITFASTGLYQTAFSRTAGEVWGLSQSTDQQLGGLLMWVPGCFIYVSGVITLLARWYSKKEPVYQPKSNSTRTV